MSKKTKKPNNNSEKQSNKSSKDKDSLAYVFINIISALSALALTIPLALRYAPKEYDIEDTDNDNLPNYMEKELHTDTDSSDTDFDGLDDAYEVFVLGTDPTNAYTGDNNIPDSDMDSDGDGISNIEEKDLGTSPISSDSDADGINDYDEIYVYNTDPNSEDSDNDGASDGYEVNNGYAPDSHDDSFVTTVSCEYDNIVASATVTSSGDLTEKLSVHPYKNDMIINDTIPGYMGSSFEFLSGGDFEIATISFTFDESILNDSSYTPTIYCLNEDTQTLYEYETSLDGNTASATTTHFSKYVLINKNEYDNWKPTIIAEKLADDSGLDSNNDGISDYVTSLICDGIIRTPSKSKIFGNYTYDEIQSNDDLDGDGIKNGDEIEICIGVDIPSDASTRSGKYYKLYDIGFVWDDAEAYCESMGGHLATITSSTEQRFIVSLLENGTKNSYWLGGKHVNGKGSWLTGEKFRYTKWAPNEPNNFTASGGEDCIMMYRGRNPMVSYNDMGDWNDLNNHAICGNEEFFGIEDFGFICEWEAQEATTNVYVRVNTSPISKDTDKDGIEDGRDLTPTLADVFASVTDYKKYYFDDELTVTICATQPECYSRNCYVFNVKNSYDPYFSTGGTGHSFIGFDYPDERKYYFGFYSKYDETFIQDKANDLNNAAAFFGLDTTTYANSDVVIKKADGTLKNLELILAHKSVPGQVKGELRSDPQNIRNSYDTGSPVFSIAKMIPITNEQHDLILEYKEKNQNNNYVIPEYNCTTFAVEALKYADVDIRTCPKHWVAYDFVAWPSFYGYCPADLCENIRTCYYECLCLTIINNEDGTPAYYGYKVLYN